MKIKTNLPKAIIYKEPEAPTTGNSISFKPNALPSADDFVKVIYEGGYFVAIGANGSVAYSEEGQTWSVKQLGDTYTFRDIDYINNEYVIVGNTNIEPYYEDGLVIRSNDLVNWTIREVPSDDGYVRFMGIMYDGIDYILISYHRDNGGNLSPVIMYKSGDLVEFTFTKTGVSFLGEARGFKGNNRIGLNAGGTIIYTADGVSYGRSLSTGLNKSDLIFFYGGYFMSGIPYGAYLFRSINAKEWEKVVFPNWGTSTENRTNFMINSAVHINDFSLYVGENKALIVRDNEDITDKSINDLFTISGSTVINCVTNSSKRIVCVGNGGVIFTANIDVNDKNYTVEPSILDQQIYIRQSDNVRMLNVKAVTSRIDENIKPENIKSGVTILGVAGTYSQ